MKRYMLLVFLLAAILPVWAENSCEDCHKGEGKQHARSVFAFELGHSVHGQEDVTCQSCHGDDPVIKAYEKVEGNPGEAPAVVAGLGEPRKLNVIMSCGKCHEDFRRNFAAGPHREIALLDCAFCHDKHAVRKASLDMINPEFCNKECHNFKHDAEFINGIRRSLVSADHALRSIESTRRNLLRKGYPANRLEKRYRNAHSAYQQLTRVFHTFELGRINRQTLLLRSMDSQFTGQANLIDAALKSRKKQKIYIIIIIAAILAGALAVWWKK